MAEQALSHAEGLARSFDATLHLVRVISLSSDLASALEAGFGGTSLMESNADIGRLMVEAHQSSTRTYLEKIANQYRENGLRAETSLLEGVADEEILQYAKEHEIDCIVVTTQGLSGLRRFFLGSVTDRIIRASEVPVVVIPPRL